MIVELKKIWGIIAPAERRKAAWILALVITMAAVETLGVLSIMPFLSVLGRPEVIHENRYLHQAFDQWGFRSERDFIVVLGVASIVIVIVSSTFKAFALHSINRFVHMQRHSISCRLLARYLSQPYAFFLERNTADLSKNILSETDQLLFNLIQPFAQMIAQGVIILAMSVLIICYDPLLALVALLGVVAIYGTIYGVVRKRLESGGVERVRANQDRYQACSEALGGIKDVKITQSGAMYLSRFERASRQYSRHLANNDTLSQTPLYLVEAAGYSGMIIVALALLWRSGDIAHVLPALGLYGFSAYRLLPAAQIVYRGIAKLKFSSPALAVLDADLALPMRPTEGPVDVLQVREGIKLEDIRFSYPSAPERLVLDEFNLVVPAGTSVGIMGASGVGKSTVMDLLLGLLEPQQGHLLVDGKVVAASNVGKWQRSVGYVPQHIYLADSTLAQNIALGVAPADIDHEAVVRAASAAQLHEFIVDKLPLAYETFVGERGVRLSGGQRQRLGIARALYRDPSILFFDEATSALDPGTERAVNDAIRLLAGEKTIVVIAHKLESLQYCDSVVHLKEGGMGESGPRRP